MKKNDLINLHKRVANDQSKRKVKSKRNLKESPPFPRFQHGLTDLLHAYSTVLSVSGANQNIRDARDHIFFLAKKRLFLSLHKNFWHALLGDSLS